MISDEDQHGLVLTAHRLLRNGLRDIVERQDVAQYLTTTAHVLRGPLMGIQGEIELLKEYLRSGAVDTNTVREICDNIQDQVDAIAAQAELMEAARRITDEGKAKPIFRVAPLASLVDKISQGMKRMAERRSITFVNARAIRALPDVAFDWDQMKVVFANLLHNACKYAHNNTRIEFLGEKVQVSGKPGIRVTVVDFGIGIRPEEVGSAIFRVGFRGTVRDETRFIEGTGMGLAVCRDIVENVHHGRIGAHCTELSERKQGTYQHCRVEFFVELPIRQTKA